MVIEYVGSILFWSAVFNLAVLLAWFGAFACGRDFLYRTHARWFKISPEQFDAIHYAGMAFYKLLILFFNVAPLLAIWLAA
ncbi:MAG: hypothetical protein PHW69_04415 [Elusimicrobiaceae bacterium]|nr:hypothetical protein [Elusimicrobiaceae bacterium]